MSNEKITKVRNTTGILLISLFAILALGAPSCSNNEPLNVELLRLPFPYKAGLAISSDIDGTESMEEFYEIQDYLCGDGQTAFGPGLGLEIGNSFWFFNQYTQLLSQKDKDLASLDSMFSGTPDRGISIFRGTSDTLSRYSDEIFELIRAGYIDCLHSYGHFSERGFNRNLAQRSSSLFDSLDLKTGVFVSHGGPENHNNLGLLETFHGDNPESVEYHADITENIGVKFIWRGQMTHCVGQNGNFSFKNFARMSIEWAQDLLNTKQDFHNDNKLVHELTLDDGRRVFEFVRFINPWGKYSLANEEFISSQLSISVLDELIENEGFLIFYTHLGSNAKGEPLLHDNTIRALRYIKDRNIAGEVFVTTTARILRYYVSHKYLNWSSEVANDTIVISIGTTVNPVEGEYLPSAQDLAGISFATSSALPMSVYLNGIEVHCDTYAEKNRRVVKIPWIPLKYPR